jgi:hypothetical protein
LPQLFQFPPTWQATPRLFSVTPAWKDQTQPEGAGVKWLVPVGNWPSHWETLNTSNLIILRQTGPGTVTRVTGSIQIAGKNYALKQPGPATTSLLKKPLLQYMSQ